MFWKFSGFLLRGIRQGPQARGGMCEGNVEGEVSKKEKLDLYGDFVLKFDFRQNVHLSE